MKKRIVLAILFFSLITGCDNNTKKISQKEKNLKLEQENEQLQKQIETSQQANEKLKRQITVLSELSPEVRLEQLYDIHHVTIGKYTDLYDKDKDGKKEKLIVYIQSIDAEGDVIKASGSVDVQLWDLNRDESEAMLGEWHVKPEQLKELWFATVVTQNYRLMFDVGNIIENFEEPLTVKATFTDYLSVKVFKEQKVIKP